jgi:hypothetical protein
MIMAAAVALLVAACGAQDTFTQDFNAAQQPLQQLLSETGGTSDPAKLGRLADGLDQTAIRMSALDAPDDAEPQFATFVKEVQASADTVRALQDAEPKQLADALTGLQRQMTRILSAEQALKTAVEG